MRKRLRVKGVIKVLNCQRGGISEGDKTRCLNYFVLAARFYQYHLYGPVICEPGETAVISTVPRNRSF
jgi:hypothetical protein